jgi:hypothetical protein
MITTFSQVTPLPLLVLSTSGRGVGWLICYIASTVVALYPDCLRSPSLFPPLLLPAAVALIFHPEPFGPDLRCWTPLACGGAVGLSDPRLHCHPARGQGSVTQNQGIVPASNIARPMSKIPRDDRCEFYPAVSSRRMTRSHIYGP